MRRFASTVILLVVAVGFGAYLYFVDAKKPLADPAAKQKVFALDAAKIEELSIKSASGDVTSLKKGPAGWAIVKPVQAPADQSNVPHIMAVVGGAAGTAYVSWLSSSDPRGYALYLRAFSIKSGWVSAPQQVSTEFGDPSVWPGDTTGISMLSPSQLVLSWGSATPSSGKKSDIFVANVGVSTH